MKKKKTLCTIMLLVFILSVFPFVTASAASKPTCKKQLYVFQIESKQGKMHSVVKFKKGDVIVKVKNSKPKTVAVKALGNELYAYGLKGGTTTVTMKVKRNKKTYTVKTKITSIPLDPFKYVKIGKRSVLKPIRYWGNWLPGDDKTQKNVYASGKLTYKLKSGWSVKKIRYNGKSVKRVSNVKPNDEIEIVLRHNKTKQTVSVYMSNILIDENGDQIE